MNDSERCAFERAARTVACLGDLARDLELLRHRKVRDGQSLHNRPEPQLRRVKRDYRAPAGRGR